MLQLIVVNVLLLLTFKKEGLAVFKEIAASADVLVQNFRPGLSIEWG